MRRALERILGLLYHDSPAVKMVVPSCEHIRGYEVCESECEQTKNP
jgi:hypothetical protein